MKRLQLICVLAACTALLGAGKDESTIGLTRPGIPEASRLMAELSPDPKSWSFVRTVIGGSFKDAERVLLDAGFTLSETKDTELGKANYYVNDKVVYTASWEEDTKDYYTLISKDSKVIGLLLEFLTPKGKSFVVVENEWKSFQRGLLNDGYKLMAEGTDESNDDYAYFNASKKIKIKVHLATRNGKIQGGEVMMGQEHLKFDE